MALGKLPTFEEALQMQAEARERGDKLAEQLLAEFEGSADQFASVMCVMTRVVARNLIARGVQPNSHIVTAIVAGITQNMTEITNGSRAQKEEGRNTGKTTH